MHTRKWHVPPKHIPRSYQKKNSWSTMRGGGAGIPIPSNCLQKGSGVILQSPPEWLGWSSLPGVSGMASPLMGARASPPLQETWKIPGQGQLRPTEKGMQICNQTKPLYFHSVQDCFHQAMSSPIMSQTPPEVFAVHGKYKPDLPGKFFFSSSFFSPSSLAPSLCWVTLFPTSHPVH